MSKTVADMDRDELLEEISRLLKLATEEQLKAIFDWMCAPIGDEAPLAYIERLCEMYVNIGIFEKFDDGKYAFVPRERLNDMQKYARDYIEERDERVWLEHVDPKGNA